MNFSEIQRLMAEQGVNICPICNTPFSAYHSRQKTCGNPDCKRANHNKYLRERKLTEEQKEKHRESNRKWRRKQAQIRERTKQMDEIIERTQKQVDFDNYIREHGHEYGKLQAEKTLSKVPKIDLNIETKGETK